MKKLFKISALAIFAALLIYSCSDDPETVIKTTKTSPTVTTGVVSGIGMSGAIVGAVVTTDGNASVTERGVCWAKDTLPTISDNKKSSGTGTGAYSITIDGLDSDTKYFVRAYATNSEGISYGATKSFTTSKGQSSTYKLGDLFEGGVIYHLNDDKTHGLAFADTVLGKMAWGCFGTAITGAVGFKIGDGAQNTKDIVKECADVDCAARFVNGLTHKGFTGWHLPSRDELLTLHKEWISQGKGKITKTVYWASNQNSNNKTDMAQTVDVGTSGALVYQQKDDFVNFSVVAVKEF